MVKSPVIYAATLLVAATAVVSPATAVTLGENGQDQAFKQERVEVIEVGAGQVIEPGSGVVTLNNTDQHPILNNKLADIGIVIDIDDPIDIELEQLSAFEFDRLFARDSRCDFRYSRRCRRLYVFRRCRSHPYPRLCRRQLLHRLEPFERGDQWFGHREGRFESILDQLERREDRFERREDRFERRLEHFERERDRFERERHEQYERYRRREAERKRDRYERERREEAERKRDHYERERRREAERKRDHYERERREAAERRRDQAEQRRAEGHHRHEESERRRAREERRNQRQDRAQNGERRGDRSERRGRPEDGERRGNRGERRQQRNRN